MHHWCMFSNDHWHTFFFGKIQPIAVSYDHAFDWRLETYWYFNFSGDCTQDDSLNCLCTLRREQVGHSSRGAWIPRGRQRKPHNLYSTGRRVVSPSLYSWRFGVTFKQFIHVLRHLWFLLPSAVLAHAGQEHLCRLGNGRFWLGLRDAVSVSSVFAVYTSANKEYLWCSQF